MVSELAPAAPRRRDEVVARDELRERRAHSSRPAREVLGAYAWDVDGLRLAGEVIERDADQNGRSGAEEAMDGVAERGGAGKGKRVFERGTRTRIATRTVGRIAPLGAERSVGDQSFCQKATVILTGA